jgi:hypothetical protein
MLITLTTRQNMKKKKKINSHATNGIIKYCLLSPKYNFETKWIFFFFVATKVFILTGLQWHITQWNTSRAGLLFDRAACGRETPYKDCIYRCSRLIRYLHKAIFIYWFHSNLSQFKVLLAWRQLVQRKGKSSSASYHLSHASSHTRTNFSVFEGRLSLTLSQFRYQLI